MESNKELKIIVYSLKDGSKIKTWNFSKQFEAKEEYTAMINEGQDVGYFEGLFYPLDIPQGKFNSIKKIFEVKSDQEMLDEGLIKLSPTQKIIDGKITEKSLYELYQQNKILTKFYEKCYKIDQNNLLQKKNIIELIEINFDEKEIRYGILEKLILLFNEKHDKMVNKYPSFESLNFNYKGSLSHLWIELSENAKKRILRSESRRKSFNVLFSEFYDSLYDEEKNDINFLLNKMDETCNLIIEKEDFYQKDYANLIKKRNYFTKKIREIEISIESVTEFIEEMNVFFENEFLSPKKIYLSNYYYSSIPQVYFEEEN